MNEIEYVPFTREDPFYKESLRSFCNDLFLQDLATFYETCGDQLAYDYLKTFFAKAYNVKEHVILPTDIKNVLRCYYEDLRHFAELAKRTGDKR